MAFSTMVALGRRVSEGGSWFVRISMAKTGRWLVGRGQVPEAELKNVPKEFTHEELKNWSMTTRRGRRARRRRRGGDSTGDLRDVETSIQSSL